MKKQMGFSLVELMVTLVIAGILLAYAVPNYRDFMLRKSIQTKSNDMLVDFMFARSEAINRGLPIRVTADGGWGDGWKIATDINRDGVLNGIDEVLRVSNSEEANIVLTDSDLPDSVIFTSTGAQNGNITRVITIKHADVSMSSNLTIVPSGSISVKEN